MGVNAKTLSFKHSEHSSRNFLPPKGKCKDLLEFKITSYSHKMLQINLVKAVDDSLNVRKALDCEANLNTDVKALDDGSVITESSETKSDMHDTSSSSRTYITHVVDANIRP
ncbi:hypothetical protein Tco_0466258 [Tanacetum coccineum]